MVEVLIVALLIVGEVNVLLVRVCIPVKVTAVPPAPPKVVNISQVFPVYTH